MNRKDAVIALAIFVLILFLWRLMTRPEQWGYLGTWAKTNVFGAGGVSLAQNLGIRGDAAGFTASETNSSSPPSPAPGATPATGTTAPFLVVTQASWARDPQDADESSGSNNPAKIIAELPVDVREVSAGTNLDADTFSRKLAEAGAKGGDIQFSLFWRNVNDLDLHCIDPKGVEIWYGNTRSELTGGELDVDQNRGSPFTATPVENIYWPANRAPPGIYRVYVVFYQPHGGGNSTVFAVRCVVQNITNAFRGTATFTGHREPMWICTIRYDPANPIPTNRCVLLTQPR